MTRHTPSHAFSAETKRSASASLKKYQSIFRMIHERRARTLFGLTGALVMLPMVVQAQDAAPQALGEIEGVESYTVQPDGSVRVTLSNGQTVVLAEGAVTEAADGSLLVSDLAASELTAASEVAFGTGGAGMGGLGGGAAAAGGGLLLAMAAGGGGGGGGDSSPEPLTKTISVVDAPLQNALVFYDSNNDGIAQESEYLGLTDATGGVNVTYTPTPGGSFIILPSPGPDGVAEYDWSEDFAAQFNDVQTYDAVTGNLFENVLEVEDNGEEGEQVASPLSTLVAIGAMTEEEVKSTFGIDEDTDIGTFNFYEALNSEDPNVQAAAKKAAAAAVVANQVAKSAVAAASAAKTGAPLTEAEKQAVVSKALTDAGKVLKELPEDSELGDAAAAATAVAVAGALNPELDTDEMSDNITTAMNSGSSASDAVENEVSAQQTAGNLSPNAGSTVSSTSNSAGTTAEDIDNLFDSYDPANPPEDFAQQLDEADDAASEGVLNAINQELLGIVLVKDSNSIIEGSVTSVRGNVLTNDAFEDGSALPSTTGIFSVNGTQVSGLEIVEGTSSFVSLVTTWGPNVDTRPVTRSAFAAAMDLDVSDIPAGYGGQASGMTTTITVEAGETLTFDYTFLSTDVNSDASFVALRAISGGTLEEQDGFIDELMTAASLANDGSRGITRSGSDTFTYTFDEAGTFELGIGVLGNPQFMSALETSNITISDGSDLGTYQLTEWNSLGTNEPGEFASTEVPATVITGYYGTLVMTKSGDYAYQVGGPNAEPIPEGVVVTEDFTYTVELEDGSKATQKLSIQVTGIADPVEGVPTIQLTVDDVTGETVEATTIAGATTNVDEGETVAIEISDGTNAPVTTTATVDANGNFSTDVDLSSLEDTDVTVTVSYGTGDATVSTSIDVTKDATADADGDLAVTLEGQENDDEQTFEVVGLDPDAIAKVTISDGTNSVFMDVADNGIYSVDISSLDESQPLVATVTVLDETGNIGEGVGDVSFLPDLTITMEETANAATAASATVSGTSEAIGLTVDITVSDGTTDVTGSAVVGNDGTYSTDLDLSTLDDGELTLSAEVSNGDFTVDATGTGTLDTIIDEGGDLSVSFDSLLVTGDTPTATFDVSGLDDDASIVITLTDGTNTSSNLAATANGSVAVDLSAFAPGAELSASYVVTDDAGNTTSDDLSDVEVMTVYNVETGAGYTSLSAAIDAATAGQTLQLSGVAFDEDIVIDKSLTLLGTYAGTPAFTDAETMDPEGRGDDESVISGTVTIAAADVTLDGLKLDDVDEPLTWDESILDSTPGGLDNFSLLNTVITTYAASGSPTFNANSDASRGSYDGPTVASGWDISGNLLGGVYTSAGSYGGAMYLSGLGDSSISDNMFWRPGGGHLYLASLSNTAIDNNFFYHGVHADGVDFDGYGDMFDGDGYGYGYGYGEGYGYGSGYGGGTAAEDFFGRNFWVELKGDNTGVTITNNDGLYNSGGIQLYGENEGYSFVDITISGNNFQDFINADPNGVLEGAAYYQSGFMGAISVSIAEGSTAEGIVITQNVISAAIDQIFSARDQTALITVQGIVDGVTVSENILTWTTSSDEILNALDALGVPSSSYAGGVSGLLLAGGISGDLLIQNNDFNGEDGVFAAASPAIYVVGEVEGFGAFMAQVGESGNDYDDWSSIEMYLSSITEEVDVGTISLEATDVYLGVDFDGEPGDEISYRYGGVSGDGDDAFSGTATNDFFYVGDGSDTVDISQGGNDLVLIDATDDADGGDTVSGFTLGEPGAGGDTFVLVGLDTADLRGTGEFHMQVTAGTDVDADAGLLIFSTALADSSDATIGTALDGLNGLNEGDEFYVVADFLDANQDVTLFNVTVGAGGDYDITSMTEFEGLTVASFDSGTDFNIGNFVELPEV